MNCIDVLLIILCSINVGIDIANSYFAYKDKNMSACRGWGCAALGFSIILLNTLNQLR